MPTSATHSVLADTVQTTIRRIETNRRRFQSKVGCRRVCGSDWTDPFSSLPCCLRSMLKLPDAFRVQVRMRQKKTGCAITDSADRPDCRWTEIEGSRETCEHESPHCITIPIYWDRYSLQILSSILLQVPVTSNGK